MRDIERAAIDSGAVTGLELMERAGQGVVEAVLEEWPELAEGPQRAVVLCGPGNNGGDGYVVARLLKERGWEMDLYLFGSPDKLPPDAAVNLRRWEELGTVTDYSDETFRLVPVEEHPCNLIVDALFGIGLSRPVTGFDTFGWCTQMARWPGSKGYYPEAHVVAVDVPSGLDADTGLYVSAQDLPRDHEDIRAHLTVTFHRFKPGHLTAKGQKACGKVVVKDIGL